MNDVFEECYTPDLGGFLAAVAARSDRAPETMTAARQFHRERAAVTAAYEPYRLGKGKQGGGRFAKKGTLGIDILRKLLKGDGKARTETHKTFTRLHSDRKSSFGKGPITPDNLNKWATKAFGPRPTSGADMNAWDAGKRELGTWTAKLPAQARQAAWAGNLVDDKPRVPAKPDTPDVTDRDMEPVVALLTPQLNVAKQDEDRLKGRGRDAAEATAKRVAIEDAIEELYNHEETGSGTPKARALIEGLQADLVTTKDGDPKATEALDKQYADVLAKLPTDKPDAQAKQDVARRAGDFTADGTWMKRDAAPNRGWTRSGETTADTPETPVTQDMPGAAPVSFDAMTTPVPNHVRESVTAGSGTKESPFVTDDVETAVFMLMNNQHVQLNSERQVSTLLDKLAAEVRQMKADGAKAKDFNLCNVTVPGTSLFCVENVGLTRIQMPQLSGIPIPGTKADALPKNKKGEVDLSAAFIEHLASRGIGVKQNEMVDPEVLKASQNELVGPKVVGMMDAVKAGEMKPGSIFVTRDDYVVDGHHRWAANIGAEYTTGEDMEMPVDVIDADIIDVLAIANAYALDMGIPQASGTPGADAPSPPDFSAMDVDVPNHIRDGVETGAGTKESPFITEDMDAAVFLLSQDQHVQLKSERQVSTLLDELKQEVEKMKAAGEAAKPFDLCKVTVPGTNLFCYESKGISRIEMPQLGGTPIAGSKADALPKNDRGEVDLSSAFIEHLRSRGVGVKENEVVPADVLKASQNELNGTKIVGMMGALEAGTLPPGAIFVSRDDYVVDGHHRWAANVGAEYTTGEEMMMPVHVIDADILEVLGMANAYAADMGIPQAGVGQMKTGAPDAPNVDAPEAPTTQDMVGSAPDAKDVADRAGDFTADGTWMKRDPAPNRGWTSSRDVAAEADAADAAPSTPPHNTPSDGSVQFTMNSDYLKGFGVASGDQVHARYRDDRYGEVDLLDSKGNMVTRRVAWSQFDAPTSTQDSGPRQSGITFTTRKGGLGAVKPEERATIEAVNPRSETLMGLSQGNKMTRLSIVDALEKNPPDSTDARLLQDVYRESQEALKSIGVEKVTLWRGMKGTHDSPFPGDSTGLTSWTTDPVTAANYSGEGGTLFKAEIPIDQILSWDTLGALRSVTADQPGAEVLVARDPSTTSRVQKGVFPFVESSAANVGAAKFDPDKVFDEAKKAADTKPVSERTVSELLAEGSSPEAIRDVLKRSDLTDSQRAELRRMLDSMDPQKAAVAAALSLADKRAKDRHATKRAEALSVAHKLTGKGRLNP